MDRSKLPVGKVESSRKRKSLPLPEAVDGGASPEANATKKKKSESGGGDEVYTGEQPPIKLRRAFAFFVKAKRPEVEANLGPNASVSDILCYFLYL